MKKRNLGLAVGLGCLLCVAGGASLMGDKPLDAVCAKAHELGFADDELLMTRGEYSLSWFGQSAEGRFTSKTRPELGEICISVRRHLPFLGWYLVHFSTQAEPK